MSDQDQPHYAERPQREIPLLYPLTVGAKTYDKVVLRRMTQGEVAAFVEKTAGERGAVSFARFPIFYDVDGAPLPDAVYAALDDDDAFALEEAATDFLPRRFRPALPAGGADSAITPASGETIAPTS